MKRQLSVGTYEADVEALLLFNLGIRYVEGVLTLARQDLVLLPGAIHLARAALESCVRAAWLVDEDEPFRREARWIAHYDGEISYSAKSSARMEQTGFDVSSRQSRAVQLRSFRDGVWSLLEERGVAAVQLPKFDRMLESIGGRDLYAIYMQASQYAHGGHAATWLYRSGGVGTEKRIGEWVTPLQWYLPLRVCWLALSHPGDLVVTRISRNRHAGWTSNWKDMVQSALDELIAG